MLKNVKYSFLDLWLNDKIWSELTIGQSPGSETVVERDLNKGLRK